jgi:hypothetical protein
MALRDLFASFRVAVDAKDVGRANAALDDGKEKARQLGRAYEELGQKIKRAGLEARLEAASQRSRVDRPGGAAGLGIAAMRLQQFNIGEQIAAQLGQPLRGGHWFDNFLNGVDEAQRKGEGFLGFLGRARRVWGLFGFATAIAGGLVANFVKQMADSAAALADVSDKTGVSIENIQVWHTAMEQAGGTAENMNKVFNFLAKSAESFGREKTVTAAFKSLNVEVKNSDGTLKDLNTIMRDTALGLADMDDPTKRLALAQKLLGKTGQALVPVLAKGRKEAEKFLDEMERLGVVISTKDAKALDEIGDKLQLVGKQFTRFILNTLGASTGVFGSLVDNLLRATNWLNRMSQQSQLFTSIWVGAGATALSIITHMGVKFGLWAGALGAIKFLLLKVLAPLLIMDELFTFFIGGRTILGDIVDSLFGIGTAATFARDLRDTLRDIAAVFSGDALAPTESQMWIVRLKVGFDEFVQTVKDFATGKISFEELSQRFFTSFFDKITKLGTAFGQALIASLGWVGEAMGLVKEKKPGDAIVAGVKNDPLFHQNFSDTVKATLESVPGTGLFRGLGNALDKLFPATNLGIKDNPNSFLKPSGMPRFLTGSSTTNMGGVNINITVPTGEPGAVGTAAEQGVTRALRDRSPQAILDGTLAGG